MYVMTKWLVLKRPFCSFRQIEAPAAKVSSYKVI